MREPTAHDLSESAPGIERTSVLPLGELEAHDVRRALVVLAGLRSPTLAPLVRSTAVPGGVALTHRVPAGAVGLASLRAAGPLRAGHVLAVGVAVLEALVEVHGARLAHGGVCAESVLVGPDGRVVLGATGAAWATAPGEPGGPTAADDVAAVGELLRDLLGPGSAPAPLVVAVVRAVDPDLALRPDAAGLLDALRRCGRPDTLLDALWAPTRSTPPAEAPMAPAQSGDAAAGVADMSAVAGSPAGAVAASRPSSLRGSREAARPASRPRRSRARGSAPKRRAAAPWRLFAVAVLAAGTVAAALAVVGRSDPVVAAAAVAVATQSAQPPADPVGPAASAPTVPSAAGVDWEVVLDELDRGRTAALAAGSPEQLRAWVTGTAYAADAALARTVEAADARLEGGGLVLEGVTAVDVSATTAVLQVRDRRSAYAVVADGIRQEVPERAARTWTVTLVLGGSPSRWRIAEVADAALSPGGRR